MMLLAALDDPTIIECVERSDGYLTMGAAIRWLAEPDEWEELDRWLLQRCRGRLLDVGAGSGRLAVPALQAGCQVLALDTSPGALSVCARRGLTELCHGTIDDLRPDCGPFDTVLMAGNNLGLLGSKVDARRLLQRLTELTRPGARIIGSATRPTGTDPTNRSQRRTNVAAGRMRGQLRIRSRYQDLASEWFDYLLLSPAELDSILIGTGWHRVDHLAVGNQYVAMLEKTAAH